MTDFGKRPTVPAHKTSHQAGGADEIDCTGLPGRVNIVHRGTMETQDFTYSDFDFSAGFHTLDMSSVVPVGAKFVFFLVNMVSPTVGRYFLCRHPGDTGQWNSGVLFAQVVDQAIRKTMLCGLNAAREIEYMIHADGFSTFDITVRAWLI